MKRKLKLLLLLAIAGYLPAMAEETNSSARLDYLAFRIIAERNIFNQNRSRGSDSNGSRYRQDRRVRADAFALRGTMSYEKGRFAFFDGTSSDYRKAVQADDTIALVRHRPNITGHTMIAECAACFAGYLILNTYIRRSRFGKS